MAVGDRAATPCLEKRLRARTEAHASRGPWFGLVALEAVEADAADGR